jgi:hypothetical protein
VVLHVYAELAATDPGAAEQRYAGVAAHLRACGPFATDLARLMESLRNADTP